MCGGEGTHLQRGEEPSLILWIPYLEFRVSTVHSNAPAIEELVIKNKVCERKNNGNKGVGEESALKRDGSVIDRVTERTS